jgi:hypothetical protein
MFTNSDSSSDPAVLLEEAARSGLPLPRKRCYGRELEQATLLKLWHRCLGRCNTGSGEFKIQCSTSPLTLSSKATNGTPPLTATNGDDSNGCQDRRSHLVILQGPKGVGKRTLSQRLQPIVEEAEGLYLSVSFGTLSEDQQSSSLIPICSPSTILLEILESLVNSLPEEKWRTMRDKICQCYFTDPFELRVLSAIWSALPNSDGVVPTKCEPTTSSIQRRQPAGSAASQRGMYVESESSAMFDRHCTSPQRFHASQIIGRDQDDIIMRFIVAVSTLVPLLVHIDGAQHAQVTDLDILQRLVFQSDKNDTSSGQALLLILCRDTAIPSTQIDETVPESVSASSGNRPHHGDPASPTLQNLRCHSRIQLENLSLDHIEQWITAWINVSGNSDDGGVASVPRRDLANLVLHHTVGNPQHVHFMLLFCQFEGLRDNLVQSGVDQIRLSLPSDPCQLFRQVIQRQDSLLRGVIETMAALIECDAGMHVTSTVLEIVASQSCSHALSVGVEHELIKCWRGQYHFADSIFQQVAYAMIPESKRAKVHLRIGRRIWKYLNGAEPEHTEQGTNRLLFAAAVQLQRGAGIVADASERKMIAFIQWEAGKRAMQSSEFSSAALYFEFAMSMICPGQTWNIEQHDFSLALHNGAAEAYYCTGDYVKTDLLLETVFSNVVTLQDKLLAYTTRVLAIGARHRSQEAVTLALEVLGQLNVSIPTNPSKMLVFMEYMKTRHLLRGKNDRFFLNLPLATDPNIVAAMTLLNLTFFHSFPIKPALALFRLIHLIVQHGLCGSALTAFSGYGLLHATSYGYSEEGYRFGKLALSLTDLVESKAWLSRIYFMVYGFINPWVDPFRDSVEPLLLASRSALKTGDIEGFVTCSTLYEVMAFLAGKPLAALGLEASSLCRLTNSLGHPTGMVFLLPVSNLICDLTGATREEVAFADNVNDPMSALNFVQNYDNRLVVAHFNVVLAMKWSILGDYQKCVEAAARARKASPVMDIRLDFVEGLSSLALARDSTGWHRRSHLSKGRRALCRLRKWAATCPANFRNKRALLQAELATVRGQTKRALALFDESIAAAKREGFVHEEGLAYERVAQYHCVLGHVQSAILYFASAREAYVRWGAHKLVERIDMLMAERSG